MNDFRYRKILQKMHVIYSKSYNFQAIKWLWNMQLDKRSFLSSANIAFAQSDWALSLHRHILQYQMVLQKGNNGHDQTVRMCRLIWLSLPHIRGRSFSHLALREMHTLSRGGGGGGILVKIVLPPF